jgi:hypothetical protein
VSVRVQSKVWEHSKASGNTLIVLLKIADNCDDAGNNAWPSIASLARYCRCSPSTVKRCVRELVELGELAVTSRGGGRRPGTRHSPNLYRVLVDVMVQSDPSPDSDGSDPAIRWVNEAESDGSLVTQESSLASIHRADRSLNG